MAFDHLAFDIETIPLKDLSEYGSAIQQKLTEKIERLQDRNPDYDYNYFASIHGDFSKIICISMGYLTEKGDIKLKSLYGEDESKILKEFNSIIKTFRGVFIHYNGLNFDVPTILQRMSHHLIRPSNKNFTFLRRFTTDPHFDLMMQYYNWDWQKILPLGILAELHSVPSPKEDLDGSEIFETYKRGEWERLVHYCEFDVATTLNLWNKIYRHKPVIPENKYIFSEIDAK